jgi:hypothetical protein
MAWEPAMFVLGLIPLVGGTLYVFCTRWIREINLRVYDRYAPDIWWILERGPLWLMRLVGAILIIIGISVIINSFGHH